MIQNRCFRSKDSRAASGGRECLFSSLDEYGQCYSFHVNNNELHTVTFFGSMLVHNKRISIQMQYSFLLLSPLFYFEI